MSDQGITMQIQVKADNRAPVISGVVAATVEPGEWAVIPVGEVASDPDGDQLSWSAPQVPAGSPAERVEYFGGGKYQYYVPADTTATSDSFTYTVDDGFGGTALGEVHVTIGQRPSQPPVAVDDTAVTAEDETLSINVGSNDSDPDTANLTYALGTQPAHGNATVWPDGTADYRPAADFTGTDTFTYMVSDGDTTATAAVTVTVTPVNDAPAAQSDTVRVVEDGSITFDPTANDTDTDGNALHLVSVGVSRYSTSVTQNADGTVTVRPATDKTLDDSFTYVVSDGTMQSTGIVRVDIVPVNDAPVASFSTSTLKPRTVVASATASDVDGDTLSYSWNWGDGTTTTTASPSARHDYARRGSYTLTLTVSDGQGGQAVTIKAVSF